MSTSLASGRASALRFLIALSSIVAASALAAAEESALSTRTPGELVQAALKSELHGPSDVRQQLLDEALKRDPHYAPARWHSGYVKFDGQWLKIDEVPRHARANESLTEYRKLRDGMIDTADNHRELARWCHKRKLLDEERIHWAKVLEFERQDAEAIAALGLKLYGGRLLTKEQIDAEKQSALDAQRAMREWQPKLIKWRRAIEQGTPKQLDEALRGLGDLDDPAAIAALEVVFAVPAKAKKGEELNQLLVKTLGRFPQQEATDVLLRRAVMSESSEVCAAAADQLKKRPLHTYVPKLIAAIPGKLKTRFNLYVLPSGMVLHEHEFYLEGNEADLAVSVESLVAPSDIATATLITPVATTREMLSAMRAESAAAHERSRSDAVSQQVRWVLERTTGFANVDDPALWKAQYDQYHTGSYSPTVKPVYHQQVTSGQTFYTLPLNTNTATVRSNTHSCFPAGTKVCTLMGDVPIESIKLGDLVLTQNIDSGELSFSPVQTTTLRQPTPMVRISMGSETIVATQAHPFWTVGQGWKSAKNLRRGDRLHTLHGPAMIEDLDDMRATEAYNLVVSERHNYFVGASRLLVHDNSPLSFAPVSVPGLSLIPETYQASRE